MKKKSRPLVRVLGITAIAVTASLVFAGCSAGATSNADGGKTILNVFGWKGVKGQEANIAEINAAFKAEHPDITLNYTAIPAGTGYTQKLQTELLGGTGPDVLMVDGGLFPQFAGSGYFEDLSKESWASKVAEGIRPFNTYKGQLQSEPMESIGVGLYSNTDVLAKAGVKTVPTDWPTFLDDLARVKAAGLEPLSIPDKGGWGGVLTFLNIGASQVPAKWDNSFYAGKQSFSPAWTPVVDKLTQLRSVGALNWKEELGIDEFAQGPGDFQKGNTAFWMQGAWNLADLKKAGLNVQFTAFPAADAGKKPNALVFSGTSWAINKASKSKEAARAYLDFWSQPKNLLKYLDAEAALSPFDGGQNPTNTSTEQFAAAVSDGRYRFMQTATWYGGDVQGQIGSKLQALFLGQTDPKTFLTDLDGIGLRKK